MHMLSKEQHLWADDAANCSELSCPAVSYLCWCVYVLLNYLSKATCYEPLLLADNTHLTPAGIKGIIAGGIIFLITLATLLLIVRDIRERSGKASLLPSSVFATVCEGSDSCKQHVISVIIWQPASRKASCIA